MTFQSTTTTNKGLDYLHERLQKYSSTALYLQILSRIEALAAQRMLMRTTATLRGQANRQNSGNESSKDSSTNTEEFEITQSDLFDKRYKPGLLFLLREGYTITGHLTGADGRTLKYSITSSKD